jgi:hypothetical protein
VYAVRRLANQDERRIADGIEQRTQPVRPGLEPECRVANSLKGSVSH